MNWYSVILPELKAYSLDFFGSCPAENENQLQPGITNNKPAFLPELTL